MTTGLFVNRGQNTAIGKRRRTVNHWPKEQLDALCDLIADGVSISAAAVQLGVSRNAATGQFNRIRHKYGWQAT